MIIYLFLLSLSIVSIIEFKKHYSFYICTALGALISIPPTITEVFDIEFLPESLLFLISQELFCIAAIIILANSTLRKTNHVSPLSICVLVASTISAAVWFYTCAFGYPFEVGTVAFTGFYLGHNILEIIATFAIILIAFGIRYKYRKMNTTDGDKNV